MRRRLPRAFNFSAAVSAAVFVAVCVLWVRSYTGKVFVRDGRLLSLDMKPEDLVEFLWFKPGRQRNVDLNAAQLTADADDAGAWEEVRRAGVDSAAWRRLGVEYRRGVAVRYGHRYPYTLVAVPLLVPAAFVAALPIAWLLVAASRSARGRLRHRRGCCPFCGYDLTGNTSGRCSSTGEPVPAERRVTA